MENSNAELNFETFVNNLSKEVSNFHPENRNMRKKGLEAMKFNVLKFRECNDFEAMKENELLVIHTRVVKPIINIMKYDTGERCREIAAEILVILLLNCEELVQLSVGSLIPVTIEHLRSDGNSEEIRVLYLQLLNMCLKQRAKLKSPVDETFDGEILSSLCFNLLDNYAESLKESCNCLVSFATNIEEESLCSEKINFEQFIEPLCTLLKHRHGKVRISAIKTIAIILKIDFKRLSKYIETVTQHLGPFISVEDSPIVREAFVEITNSILLDRLCLDYKSSHLLRFLPLVLTSLSDPVEAIRKKGWLLWLQSGEKYFEIHQKIINQQQESINSAKIHPPDCIKPNTGCHCMVTYHLSGLLPATLNEVNDSWSESTRNSSISLLYQLILHSEDGITQYLVEILSTLIKLCAGFEQRHGNELSLCEKCCQLIGYFINSPVWCETLLPMIDDLKGNDSLICGSFIVMDAILKNSVYSSDVWKRIAAFISQPAIYQCASQTYLLGIVESLVKEQDNFDEEFSFNIFVILITISSMMEEHSDYEKVQILLKSMACLIPKGLKGNTMYDLHFKKFVTENLYQNYQVWDISSREVYIFKFLIETASPSLLFLHKDLILEIITHNISTKKDALFKLKLYSTLSTFLTIILDSDEIPKKDLNAFGEHLINNIFLPQLGQKTPGLSANALKTASLSCFLTLLERKWSDNVFSFQLIENCVIHLTPVITNLMENSEDNIGRTIASKVIAKLFLLNPLTDATSLKLHWKSLEKAIISRFELDVNSAVRLSSCESLDSMFKTLYHSGCQNFLETKEVTRVAVMELDITKNQEHRIALKNLLASAALLAPEEVKTDLENYKANLLQSEAKNIINNVIEQINDMQI